MFGGAAAAVHLTVLLVAALGRVMAYKFPEPSLQVKDPRLEETGRLVASWTPNTGVSPWELSALEDSDILHRTNNLKAARSSRHWDNNRITFLIETPYFLVSETQRIYDAINILNSISCVKFRESRGGERDFVRITGKQEGCYSEYWGRMGGEQQLNLQAPTCLDQGTILHELMHVIGFRHVHNAPDRSRYIRIFEENMKPESRKHFRIYKEIENYTDFGLGYDYCSIMHVSRKAHSNNGKDTVEPCDKNAKIGRRGLPSPKDTKKIKLLYNCENV